MWLDRLSGQSTPPTSQVPWNNKQTGPAPGRNSLHINRNANLRRPELPQRVSSWSGLVNGSSGPPSVNPREQPRSSLRSQIKTNSEPRSNPLDILNRILAPSKESLDNSKDDVEPCPPDHLNEDIDFRGLSLEQFASAGQASEVQAVTFDDEDHKGLEELHKSIRACDEILVSVEKNLTVFQADLAAVSAEIETLQNKSIDLSERLQRRKEVEKRLAPEVGKLLLPPAIVRKIAEGPLDDAWAQALQHLEKAVKARENASSTDGKIKAEDDIGPLLGNLTDRAVERIRDHVVTQIKALRSPSINAQILQRNALSKFKDAYSFLAKHQPKLEEEIAQAYINTMRWYYLSHFTRYKAALDKLHLHVVDKTDTLAKDDPTRRVPAATGARLQSGPIDVFSLGRRIDTLRSGNPQAMSSFVAEEDKAMHTIETPFRAFNLALIDNASAEFSFMTEFFSKSSFHTVSKRFLAAWEPTLSLGQALTKQLVETSSDALGILLCVRLNQHFAFELQRRKVSSMEGYINGTSMQLWPRFQIVMDVQCEALKKTAASLSGRPSGSALSLTGSSASTSSVAPHAITQRFANFLQGILSLSHEAGDDEPVQRSLGRLKDEFLTLLVKLSKGIADAKKRERFLVNNYSLIGTIIADTEGRMADEFKDIFSALKDANGG